MGTEVWAGVLGVGVLGLRWMTVVSLYCVYIPPHTYTYTYTHHHHHHHHYHHHHPFVGATALPPPSGPRH